ncbi:MULTISPECIES: TetR/AcrR family transcriptional regulator [Serratia]|jgi:AcrR family transcriptional regulator|uniref:TetR family transcriptional regulator n=1 Tax=Serratia grimesii TaxID=82995 RepID=A0A7G2JRG0_9GAMM|nr:TetR/AcrR family transcriptional regulator [Serratia grimesii]CAI0813015.1 transcriptional regulator BetI [Serratia grimesii]CAI2789830.1 transcriptional regulator BetI [Serratia grimesii]CUW21012.1 HTH-type transcriptional regulator BetI [Serratia grimesii]SMZ57098.1 HTH-type transcriptional regulator BetI [Serratia grimesii]HCK00470.1 TetR family transcriptional regulator [Serratia grimesii]
MGRQRSIDRDKVLDVAEEIVATQGAAGLTIDSVAKAMGISKGGVQYCFGSKDALIDAMFERWGKAYDKVFDAIAGENPSATTTVQAHMQATRSSDQASSAKAAGLMATLIQTPEHLDSTRDWYRSRITGLDLTTEEGKRARVAFLATEGAFMLRFFGLMDIDQSEWDSMFADVQSVVLQQEK